MPENMTKEILTGRKMQEQVLEQGASSPQPTMVNLLPFLWSSLTVQQETFQIEHAKEAVETQDEVSFQSDSPFPKLMRPFQR